jgi:hypothetical protein
MLPLQTGLSRTTPKPRFDTSVLDDESWMLLALAGERPTGPRWVAPRRSGASNDLLRFGCGSPAPGAAWSAMRPAPSADASLPAAPEHLRAPQLPPDW